MLPSAECGTTCGAGMYCNVGVCGCAPGFTDCDGNPANGCEVQGACACSPGETRSCYGGPMGTAGVGICKEGTQSCDSGGTGWSTCTGQVMPSAEVCGNSLDDNCDGTADENLDADGDGWGTCDGDCCATRLSIAA